MNAATPSRISLKESQEGASQTNRGEEMELISCKKRLNALNSAYDDNQPLRSNSGSLEMISEQNKHF